MINNSDIDALVGATVYGPGGDKLGKVGEVYLDNRTGNPAWITVVTGLFGTRRHFVPIDVADLDGKDVRLPFDKDTVTGAPNIDEDGRLTPEEETQLYRYYDRADTDTDTGRSPDADRTPDADRVRDTDRTPDTHRTPDTQRPPQGGVPGVATSAPPSATPSHPGGGAGGTTQHDAPSSGPRLHKRVVTTEYYVDEGTPGQHPDQEDRR
ncbi:PRC-barrel domain containing protein [Rhodococcus sp. 14C212]|uniref:PRC-barrel domain-containing protein n=1 Tax=Rhodococcus sp. 14C212 TaxID=2711209 RepID=UPI0013EBB4BE|nr:PRC-barrel domain-containing protein [Rhodococcus sp. 14C212]NGP04842.1 PRC-barrel domain containing protein [Rhodococcus sp. 14C212]